MSGGDALSRLLRDEMSQAAADVILPALQEVKKELVEEIRDATRVEPARCDEDSTGLMSIKQIAEVWSVHPKTVRRRIKSGRLRHVREGGVIRVRRCDVDAFFADASRDDVRRNGI